MADRADLKRRTKTKQFASKIVANVVLIKTGESDKKYKQTGK